MRQHIDRAGWYALGVITMVLAMHSQAQAGAVTPVPEIDGSTLSAGFGLLAAGVLIVRSRMKSK
jgi:hypothetical protein